MGLKAWEKEGAEEEKKEKIPHMCESVGYRPLRGRCPKRKGKKKKQTSITCHEIHASGFMAHRQTV